MSRYAKLAAMIDDDSRHAAIKNNYGGKAGFFKAAIDIYMHGLIAKTQESQKAQMTCLRRNGRRRDLRRRHGLVCENLRRSATCATSTGTSRAWLSPAMKARRKRASDGCFCTHESNSYYPSLPFNPGHLIQIKKLEREMKKSHPPGQERLLEPRVA